MKPKLNWRPLFESPKETLTASQRETLDASNREADKRMEQDQEDREPEEWELMSRCYEHPK